MLKIRFTALFLLLIGAASIFFVINSEKFSSNEKYKFKYGLDLDGGTSLTYRADVSAIDPNQIEDLMNSLRNTIEKRVNLFGVSEPIVQIEKGGVFGDKKDDYRLVVELPGVTDITEAIKQIGKTPVLEFKLERNEIDLPNKNSDKENEESASDLLNIAKNYETTGLTGAQLRRAGINFDNFGNPIISLNYNEEGKELLAKITSENIGTNMPIFLDGEIISNPVINDKITNGEAQITGNFKLNEAKELVKNLNFGALPAPIELIETKTIGSTLGKETLSAGIMALIYSFTLIFIFMFIWYRLPGFISIITLLFYVSLMLSLFKLIPVTLTAAGLAGFILSIGMAVDANVLIFERIKEELEKNSNLYDAIKTGTDRAWPSIRDGNLTSLISAVVLYWMSGTSLVQGFALVFGIGVMVSMFTAVVITKALLLSLSSKKDGSSNSFTKKIFGSGFGFINKLK